MVLLEHNNTIYMGDNMIDSLANPVQCEDNDVRFGLRLNVYYPNNNNAHLINFPDGTLIPVDDDGVIPFIVVCKPTKYNVEYCKRISLTSKSDLDPYGQ